MSTLQKARREAKKLTRSFENQAKQARLGISVGGAISGDPGRISGLINMGARRQERESYEHFREWVYVSINAVAKRLAGQEILAGEITNAPKNPERQAQLVSLKNYERPVRDIVLDDDPDFVESRTPSRIRQKAATDQDLELLPTHPVIDVFCHPNKVQRKFEFLYFSAANLLLTGVCYWIGGVVTDLDENGQPVERVEMWAVPTHWVTPLHENGLFTGYRVQVSSTAEPMFLPPENVARTYFPDPSDLKGVYSPLTACLRAAKVDSHIQESQEQMFERGINPNLIVTMGRVRGPDGKLSDRRPRLSGEQRRQIIRGIREVWGNTVNLGDPAIIDGMIEGVHKLQMTPQEMDWMGSGEVVKKRIMQTFGVNPIVVGEITGVNRAQAAVADASFCNQAVNPIGDAFSETATDFLGPMYAVPERLVVWIDPCRPKDEDLELKKWVEARKQNDVTRNEFRTEILGLAPIEEEVERNALLSSHTGMQISLSVLTAKGNRQIKREQAINFLMLYLEIDEETAEALVGEEEEEPGPIPPMLPQPGGQPPQPQDEDEVVDEDADNLPAEGGNRAPFTMSRKQVQTIFVKQVSRMETAAGAKFASHFRRTVLSTTEQIAALQTEPDPERATEQATAIIDGAFDLPGARQDLFETALEPMFRAFATGARTELDLRKAFTGGIKTTAEELAARLQIDVPDGISIGAMPEWLRQAAIENLGLAFEEDYWQNIDKVTRDDLIGVLREAIEEGLSMRRAAVMINKRLGASYSLTRGMLVARTEVPNALNAGHAAGIEQLEDESGLQIGKEWLSVLGNTTRTTHAAADGQQVATAKGLFNLAGHKVPWPAHHSLPAEERCNCQAVLPSTPVIASGIYRAFRGWYEGEVTEIIAGNIHATFTANHPIATPNGFVAAKDIKVGEYLLTNSLAAPTYARVAVEHVDWKPARIDQVFDAMLLRSASGISVVERMRCEDADFHGDAARFNCEVDVVRSAGELWGNDNAVTLQELAQFGLKWTCPDGIQPVFSPSAERPLRAGGLSGKGNSSEVGGISSCPTATLSASIIAVPDRDLVANQEVFGGTKRQSEPSADAADAAATEVDADRIVSIRRFHYSGLVYDLSTDTGTYYAGGILASNCTIISSLVAEVLGKEEPKEPVLL